MLQLQGDQRRRHALRSQIRHDVTASLGDRRGEGTAEASAYGLAASQRGGRLEERLRELAGGAYPDEHSRRIANRLRKHANELTLFLWDEAASADNNAAERALRPAVILRKITGGSRSERGAKARAVLLSIARTIRQHELPLLETFKDLLMASWAKTPFEDVLDKASASSS